MTDAVEDAQWCSSDPICSDGIISTSESMNNAACHSCLLLPETSCEQFNCFWTEHSLLDYHKIEALDFLLTCEGCLMKPPEFIRLRYL